MIRISFRQSMLAGFLLIAVLLGWTTVQSWMLLEQFVEQSQRANEQALQLNESTQELAQRTIDLERTVRQVVVLNDAALLQRFDENVINALALAKRLEPFPEQVLGGLPAEWIATVSKLSQELHQSEPQAVLLATLARLNEINGLLAQKSRRWIDEQNTSMRVELERNRLHLTGLLAITIVGAFLVALAMSWWLTRPIEKLEQSIEQLGEGRFDRPVEVRGPADLRQIGRRLDWLRLRLDELESGRERTLRHVSHELKTPLTALREGIALLEEEIVGHLDAPQKEVVDILQHNVLSLQRHIESLLRLNAIALEARHLNYRPVDLKALLTDVVQNRELQIQARRLSVECRAPTMTRLLDGEKLRVALDNLLSNAIDFSPEGGTIWLDARLSSDILQVTCADQGPGVAPEDAERIFEPFVQGNRAAPAPRQGSGVGLSIVRELMMAMGGQIRLLPSTDRARGAIFQIEVCCEH